MVIVSKFCEDTPRRYRLEMDNVMFTLQHLRVSRVIGLRMPGENVSFSFLQQLLSKKMEQKWLS